MTNASHAWGSAPSKRFDAIAERFRGIFAEISEDTIRHDLERELRFDDYETLKNAGFSRLRLPEKFGGLGLTLPELFGLIIELAQADPNLTNAYRSHLGFTEDLLNAPPSSWRDAWLERIGRGETIGSGFSEIGDAKLGTYSTQLTRDGGGWRLNGEKYYTTGSLYADWITLAAVDGDGVPVGALVPTKAEGVEILNDWDGFGQALTASGTARFTDVAISEDLIKPSALRFSYSGGFFQLVHLASLAGIGRAAALEIARHVAERKRVYQRSNAARCVHCPVRCAWRFCSKTQPWSRSSLAKRPHDNLAQSPYLSRSYRWGFRRERRLTSAKWRRGDSTANANAKIRSMIKTCGTTGDTHQSLSFSILAVQTG